MKKYERPLKKIYGKNIDLKMSPFESLEVDGFAARTENDVEREMSRLVVFGL